LTVFRSRNNGDSWEAVRRGLPGPHAYAGVLRGAMDTDHLDPGGIYCGTTSGEVYVSNSNMQPLSVRPGGLSGVRPHRTSAGHDSCCRRPP
jgi:hypothetical protein